MCTLDTGCAYRMSPLKRSTQLPPKLFIELVIEKDVSSKTYFVPSGTFHGGHKSRLNERLFK